MGDADIAEVSAALGDMVLNNINSLCLASNMEHCLEVTGIEGFVSTLTHDV